MSCKATNPYCVNCGVEDVPLHGCSRCKLAKYCGTLCQKAHWKDHKKNCLAPEDRRPNPTAASANECSICMQELATNVCLLPCKHTFHVSCVAELRKHSSNCPMCRAILPAPPEDIMREAALLHDGLMKSNVHHGVRMKMVIAMFQEAANQGLPVAQFALASLYKVGHGVDKDEMVATQWLKKSAEGGLSAAQSAMGNIYTIGNGVKADDKESFYWHMKAAEQGHADSQFAVGTMLFCARGTTRNVPEALMWLFHAAEQGQEEAVDLLKIIKVQMGRKVA
jgi:Ring finger domain/MYND finger/Sel1 repeat